MRATRFLAASFAHDQRVFEMQQADPVPPRMREVFNLLACHPGLSASEVQDRLALAPETAARAFKGLLDLGWIAEGKDAHDRRVKRFGMTEQGLRELRRRLSIIRDAKVTCVEEVTIWDGVTPWTSPDRTGVLPQVAAAETSALIGSLASPMVLVCNLRDRYEFLLIRKNDGGYIRTEPGELGEIEAWLLDGRGVQILDDERVSGVFIDAAGEPEDLWIRAGVEAGETVCFEAKLTWP